MDIQPRVNYKYLSSYIGRHVILMAEINDNIYHHPVVKTSDGHNVHVNLPPGESFETRYVQFLGKVEDDLSLSVLLSTPAGNNFNMANYDHLVEMINGKFQYLFM